MIYNVIIKKYSNAIAQNLQIKISDPEKMGSLQNAMFIKVLFSCKIQIKKVLREIWSTEIKLYRTSLTLKMDYKNI